MRNHALACCGPVWVVACGILIGCKPAPPEEQPPAQAPTADAEPVTPQPTPSAWQPAGEPIVDDPGAPAGFPGDEEVAGWHKCTGVQVAVGQGIAELLGEDLARRLVGFDLSQLAWAEYEYSLAGPVHLATLFLLETSTPEEAFGVGTVLAPGADRVLAGLLEGVTTHGVNVVRVAGGGRHVGLIAADAADEPAVIQASAQLLSHLMAADPATQFRPVLLDALPTEEPTPSRVWLVRRASALAAAAENLPLEHPDQIDQLLGLAQTEAWLLVACYPVSGGERDNCVWLCAYSSEEQATAAHLTYRNLIERWRPDWTRSTFLKSPIGRYLLGTWTSEEESIQPVLDRIAERLAEMS